MHSAPRPGRGAWAARRALKESHRALPAHRLPARALALRRVGDGAGRAMPAGRGGRRRPLRRQSQTIFPLVHPGEGALELDAGEEPCGVSGCTRLSRQGVRHGPLRGGAQRPGGSAVTAVSDHRGAADSGFRPGQLFSVARRARDFGPASLPDPARWATRHHGLCVRSGRCGRGGCSPDPTGSWLRS